MSGSLLGSGLSDSDVLRASLCLATLAPEDTLRIALGRRVADHVMRYKGALALSSGEVNALVTATVHQGSRHHMFDRADCTAARREAMLRELRVVLSATLRESGSVVRAAGGTDGADSAMGVGLLLALHVGSGAEELMGSLLSSKLSRVERREVDDMRACMDEVDGVDVLALRALIDALVSSALRAARS